MVASSSCLRDTAAAVLGMRHLPSWAHLALAHAPLTASCGGRLSLWAGLRALGSLKYAHYVVTHSTAECSRAAALRPRASLAVRICLCRVVLFFGFPNRSGLQGHSVRFARWQHG